MKTIFKDFAEHTLVIFDNIVIGADSIEQLLDRYEAVLDKCIEYNVVLKLSKSTFKSLRESSLASVPPPVASLIAAAAIYLRRLWPVKPLTTPEPRAPCQRAGCRGSRPNRGVKTLD